jgi:hypothetical protein
MRLVCSRMKTAYFVAPTAVRGTVRTEGIVLDPVFDTAIRLYDSEALARDVAAVRVEHYVSAPEGTADIWRIEMDGIEATVHAHIVDGENVEVDLERIPPERLSLLATL